MSFSLKLDVSTNNISCACSLCDLLMDKIKALQQTIKSIESVEVHLFESVREKAKGATLRIKTAHDVIVETCNSRNWEDAVATAYESIFNYFLNPSLRGNMP
jgi:ribosome-associated translation inhibitor RaiA